MGFESGPRVGPRRFDRFGEFTVVVQHCFQRVGDDVIEEAFSLLKPFFDTDIVRRAVKKRRVGSRRGGTVETSEPGGDMK